MISHGGHFFLDMFDWGFLLSTGTTTVIFCGLPRLLIFMVSGMASPVPVRSLKISNHGRG